MSEKVYHENAGKGDHRRVEDRNAIESNWDKIDWSRKSNPSAEEDSGCSSSITGCSNASENVPVGE